MDDDDECVVVEYGVDEEYDEVDGSTSPSLSFPSSPSSKDKSN